MYIFTVSSELVITLFPSCLYIGILWYFKLTLIGGFAGDFGSVTHLQQKDKNAINYLLQYRTLDLMLKRKKCMPVCDLKLYMRNVH